MKMFWPRPLSRQRSGAFRVPRDIRKRRRSGAHQDAQRPAPKEPWTQPRVPGEAQTLGHRATSHHALTTAL